MLELGDRFALALRDALDRSPAGVPDPPDEHFAAFIIDLVGLVRHVLPEPDALDLAEDFEVDAREASWRRCCCCRGF